MAAVCSGAGLFGWLFFYHFSIVYVDVLFGFGRGDRHFLFFLPPLHLYLHCLVGLLLALLFQCPPFLLYALLPLSEDGQNGHSKDEDGSDNYTDDYVDPQGIAERRVLALVLIEGAVPLEAGHEPD